MAPWHAGHLRDLPPHSGQRPAWPAHAFPTSYVMSFMHLTVNASYHLHFVCFTFLDDERPK
ncbi:hypothetical protein HAX54_003237, partial [Datura stramonium]|nr:hypothetical protein [Datura stramonium]